MIDNETDPFELHARRFLSRLQHVVERFRGTTDDLDGLLVETDKFWLQILAAWKWSCSLPQNSSATEIRDALNACTNGGSLHELQRTPDEIMRWSRAASDFTKRLVTQPNEAAFLFKTAGIAMVESGLLKVANETGASLDDVLRIAGKLWKNRKAETDAVPPAGEIPQPLSER